MFISVRRVSADGASLVWSVDRTRWPVSADSMAIFAESSGLVDGADLHRGDRVRVIVRQEPGRLVAVEIQKIR